MTAPTLTAPDLRTELATAQDWYADLVAAVRDDQLDGPTPCTEFDVRQLLAHMSVVQEKIVGFATEHRDTLADHDEPQAIRDASAEQRATAHVDGLTPDARADAARAWAQQARTVWTDDVLDTPIQLGWGPVLPGRIVAAIYLMEVLTHSWDLATATGQPSTAPGALGEAGLAAARMILPESPRGAAAGVPFGPVVVPAADADATEQMVNWTGRVTR